MTEEQPVLQYVSQSEIARELGTRPSTVKNALNRHALKPDAYVGSTAVFSRENASVAAYKAMRRK